MAKGLLGESEAADITDQAILPRISVFAASWLRCEITDDRLALTTVEPLEYQRLADVALGLLDALPETPLALLGINRFFHYPIDSTEHWHAAGDKLVPKDLWSDIVHLPGMRSLTIEGARQDGFLGWVRIRVEPSTQVQPGIFIEHNDHFVLMRDPMPPKVRSELNDPQRRVLIDQAQASAENIPIAREILADFWTESLTRAQTTARRLIKLATKE